MPVEVSSTTWSTCLLLASRSGSAPSFPVQITARHFLSPCMRLLLLSAHTQKKGYRGTLNPKPKELPISAPDYNHHH